MTAELPASERETAARAVIDEAGAALAARRNDIPADFAAQLYAHAVADDVLHYAAPDLADLAERAFDCIKERKPGAPKIRCETATLKTSGERKAISVIEIVNDDMPFLLGLGAGRNRPSAGVDVLLRACIRSSPSRRDAARPGSPRFKGARSADPRRARARASSTSISSTIADDAARRAELVRRARAARSPTSVPAVQDWRAMLASVADVHRRRPQGQSAAAAGGRRSPRPCSSCNGSSADNFTFPRPPQLRLRPRYAERAGAGAGQRVSA